MTTSSSSTTTKVRPADVDRQGHRTDRETHSTNKQVFREGKGRGGRDVDFPVNKKVARKEKLSFGKTGCVLAATDGGKRNFFSFSRVGHKHRDGICAYSWHYRTDLISLFRKKKNNVCNIFDRLVTLARSTAHEFCYFYFLLLFLNLFEHKPTK